MSTRAIQFLKKRNIAHEVIAYDHLEKGAVFAAQAVGFPLEQTIKTLVVTWAENQYCLVLTPGDCQLSLKKAAKVLSTKRMVMADEKTAEKVTGYKVGGISPFGTTRRLPVVLEQHLTHFPEVMLNAGQRGMMLKMDPDAIVTVLDCTVAPISDSISG